MTLSDIRLQLQELYHGADISESVISQITDDVIDDVKAWQNLPLDSIYPIVYFDCIVVKIRQDRPTRTVIGVKKTAEFVKEHCQKFYENIEQAKIIICGDSAGWIKEVADYLGAQFVLDKFHLIRTLYLGIMAGNKGKYLKEYNHCKNLINNGQYDELINYLYKELDNHKKLKNSILKIINKVLKIKVQSEI